MIELGDKAKDKITGFKGTVIGITSWMNGCTRIGIQCETLKDGKPLEPEWFDVEQIEIIKSKQVSKRKKSGGPMPDPVRR